MNKVTFHHVNAFTDKAFGGNPAGVIPDAEKLSDATMQLIARELNLSETAFLSPSTNNQADFRVRYFTPTNEIDFCGHATISVAWIMATEYKWMDKTNIITLETNIGLVPITFSIEDGMLQSVTMGQIAPQIKNFLYDINDLCSLIGVAEQHIDSKYPIKLAYTGNWHLLIPIISRAAIDQAVPKIEHLEKLNLQHNVSTTHLFTFDCPDEEYLLYTRDFAPAVGIAEDPVTGSANGALAGYLVLEGILDRNQDHTFTIAQGHTVNRPGLLNISIDNRKETPSIFVGGKVAPIITGTITF